MRETIIRGIEDNDYAACGGDFYARGHIRAIAQAVGEDPLPLIDEFDSTFRSATEFTAAEAFQPVMPMRNRERRRVRWTAALAVIVLGVLGFASYKFVIGVSLEANARRRHHSPAGPIPSPPRSAPRTPDQRPGGNPVCYSLGYPLALTAHPGGGPRCSPPPAWPRSARPEQASSDKPSYAARAISGNTRPRPGTASPGTPRRTSTAIQAPACCSTWAARSPITSGEAFAGQPFGCRPSAAGRASPSRRGCPRSRPPRTCGGAVRDAAHRAGAHPLRAHLVHQAAAGRLGTAQARS